MDNFNEIYAKYRAYAAVIARTRIKDEEAINDILQQVFFKLSKQDIKFKDEPSLMAWIKVTTNRTCIDYQRARMREGAHMQNYLAETYNNEEPYTNPDQVDKDLREIEKYVLDFIVKEINKLPPKARRTFCLYYMHEMTGKQIAKLMGVSANTVRNHLMNARDALRMNILFNKKAASFMTQPLLFKTGEKNKTGFDYK